MATLEDERLLVLPGSSDDSRPEAPLGRLGQARAWAVPLLLLLGVVATAETAVGRAYLAAQSMGGLRGAGGSNEDGEKSPMAAAGSLVGDGPEDLVTFDEVKENVKEPTRAQCSTDCHGKKLAFSTIRHGGATGEVDRATVGRRYRQTIYVRPEIPTMSKINFGVVAGWSLPPGLQLQDCNRKPVSASGGLSHGSNFSVVGTPTAAGQYNVAFFANTTCSPSCSQSTVVYHFLVHPSGESFYGVVTSTMKPVRGKKDTLGYNELVLPPGTLHWPYDAQIVCRSGAIASVALMTQLHGSDSLVSAVSVQQPVNGLIAGDGGNVIGVSQGTGAIQSGSVASVAGLQIEWTSKDNTVSISGQPTVSVGGQNDPLYLVITSASGQQLVYGFALNLSPDQIRKAYGFSDVTFPGGVAGTGKGQTVAILGIGDNAAFVSSTDRNYGNSDLSQFIDAWGLQQFGGPGGPAFLKVDMYGRCNYPPQANAQFSDPTEVPQDIQWVHALAPLANIVLFELPQLTDQMLSQMFLTISSWNISGLPAPSIVVSSFGGSSLNLAPPSTYPPGITSVTSSGDFGPSGLPSAGVVNVGYTQLQTNSAGDYLSERSVLAGLMMTTAKMLETGGGLNPQVPQPSWQKFIPNDSSQLNPLGQQFRTFPDVCFNGAQVSGVAVYDSYENTVTINPKTGERNFGFGGTPWGNAWGTSIAAPSTAALFSIANEGRSKAGKKPLDGPGQVLPALYSLSTTTSALHKVWETIQQTTQIASPVPTFMGKLYYNAYAGLGSPSAPGLVAELIAL